VNSSGRERLVTATKVESAARLTTVPWSRHNDAERGGDAISCRRWPYAVSAGVQLKMCKKPPAIGAPTGWLTQSVSVQPFKRIDENRADRSLTPARLIVVLHN
jgi:hypothetical protein